jgi:hypothetical protein
MRDKSKPFIQYNKENETYELVNGTFESYPEPEDDGCIRFVGSLAPMTQDEDDVGSLGFYTELVQNEIIYLNEVLDSLEWFRDNFTNISVSAAFYPREGDYNTYVDIPTKQFEAYCGLNNLPSPIK